MFLKLIYKSKVKKGNVVQVQIGEKSCGELLWETDIAFTCGDQLQLIIP